MTAKKNGKSRRLMAFIESHDVSAWNSYTSADLRKPRLVAKIDNFVWRALEHVTCFEDALHCWNYCATKEQQLRVFQKAKVLASSPAEEVRLWGMLPRDYKMELSHGALLLLARRKEEEDQMVRDMGANKLALALH